MGHVGICIVKEMTFDEKALVIKMHSRSLFTKRTDILLQNLVKSRSREIQV